MDHSNSNHRETENSFASVILTSGQTLALHNVFLYPAQLVRELFSLKSESAKALGGFSSGVGFFGSPEWVLGGALALGLLNGAVSSIMKEKGADLLAKSQEMSTRVSKSGKWFALSSVLHSDVPNPQVWQVTETETIVVDDLEPAGQRRLRMQFGLPELPTKSEREIEHKFVHSGEEFVTVDTDSGIMNVRWAHVAAYRPPTRPARSNY